MEIPQEDNANGEEMRLLNQVTALSESIEVKSEESGVSSIMSESLIEVKPELCDRMSEDIGVSKCEPTIEEEPKLCNDGKSVDFNDVAEPAVKESEPKPVERETESVCYTTSVDEPELKRTDESLASSIEIGLGKVSLTTGDDDEKSDVAKEKTNAAVSEIETSSSSSSASDSSSSEEEETDEEENKKEKNLKDQVVLGKEADMARELEEGEIESVDEEHEDDDDDEEVDEMIAWSNDEDEEPIRSKNELKELPPVPAVDVTLEPHHAMLPVGVVLSVMSKQVIVEGMEKLSPLTEGSILWITERRMPLGLVDEIFGPVKCPYYIVRFNSESEMPEGISQGTPISFVADFAQHILNIKDLQKKGYDASGDNDEEIADELEFSDDEKEAEYKRMQKIEKRGNTNDQRAVNIRNKKKKNQDLGRSARSYSGEWTENHGSSSLSSNRSDPQMGGPVSNHQPRPQMDGSPPNGGTWRPENNQQNPFQLPPMPPMQILLMAMQNQNQMMFQPQFNGGQMSMPGGPGGLNFFPGSPLVGQNCFNQQPFGMVCGIQHPQVPNELNINLFGSQVFQMHQQLSPVNPLLFQTHPQYQMLNRTPQSPVMQPQSEMRPQSQITQSPTNPQSQEFSTGNYSEQGRRHSGRGRGRGRGRFGRGRGRGRGRQQSG